MENFDPNLAQQMATKQLKMTFQQWGYKGTAIYTIGGNTCEVEDYSDEIPSMLVSLAIVDVKKKNQTIRTGK